MKEKDWRYFFKNQKIDNLLAEHVLEHLHDEQVKLVLSLASQFLNQGGVFRIAVPDANHSNPEYIEFVKPGGIGSGAMDHKSFWNYQSLSALAKKYNFKIELLEYFNENGQLLTNVFDDYKGKIIRSKQKGFVCPPISNYTSLIIDLTKL